MIQSVVVELSNLTGLKDLSGLNHYLLHDYQKITHYS